MPSLEWNKTIWDKGHDWNQEGDEWSAAWGSAEAQWYGSIFPRLHGILPVASILEIGPGHGRWTQFLARHCERLELVDISETCIESCRRRFAAEKHIGFHVNDGASLDMIDDESIDFVFSFDSLVHTEDDVMGTYLTEIAKKLTAGGVGLVHHSNLGQYRYFKIFRFVESLLRGEGAPSSVRSAGDTGKQARFRSLINLMSTLRIVDRTHMRALSMTAEKFAAMASNSGLRCLSQEIIRWGQSRRLIDCLSVFQRCDAGHVGGLRTLRNKRFMQEAALIKSYSELYG